MDDLRLPTPPPLPPQAPVHSLPFKSDRFPRFASLEYPGPVRNVDNALAAVGGLHALSSALSAEQPKAVELNLQPSNPFFHTIPAHVATTRNVVVKITKRRRKRPKVDGAGNVEEGVFTLEPVGIEHKTVRFRAMADFQFTPTVSLEDPIINLAHSIRSMDITGIRNFTMPPPSEEFPESAYLPPPSFSRHALPQNFDMKPHSATVRTTTDAGLVRLINQTRHRTRALQTILFVQSEVPQGPEQAYLKEIGRTDLTPIEERLRGLLEERPVWVRTAITNQLAPEELKIVNVNKTIWPMIGYTFGDGPFRDLVIRFGYDPRKDPQARFYQHVTLRNAANVRSKASHGARGLIQAASAAKGKEPNQTTSNLSHEFDGEHVYGKVGNYQLIDISDPLCSRLIHSMDGVLPACSSDNNEGWYAFDYFDQIHQVVRRKWQGLLAGLVVSDEDCQDLIDMKGLSKESREGYSRTEKLKMQSQAREKAGGGRVARARSGSEATAPESGRGGSDSEGSYGGGGRRSRGASSAAVADGEEDEAGGRGSGSEGGAGSGVEGVGGEGSDSGASSSAAQGSKPKERRRVKRAPWEAPRTRSVKAKQPETEMAVLARLERRLRSGRGSTSTPLPSEGDEAGPSES